MVVCCTDSVICPWYRGDLFHCTLARTYAWNCFPNQKLNTFFLRIFSLLGWLSFPVYQVSHNYHHRFTLHPVVDKELVLPKVPSLKPLYLLQLFTFNFSGGFESRGLIPTLKGFWGMATDRFNHPISAIGMCICLMMHRWDDCIPFDRLVGSGLS